MKHRKTIAANEPFQILGYNFAIYCADGGTISFSTDGVNYSDYEETIDADTNVIINGAVCGMFAKITADAIILV